MNSIRKDALFLIDDLAQRNYSGLRSGWDYDGRGDGGNNTFAGNSFILNKADEEGPVTIKRDFTPITDGKMTFELSFTLTSGDGFFLSFGNENETALKLVTQNGVLTCGGKKVCDFPYAKHYLKLVMDTDSKKLHIFADKKDCGVFDFIKGINLYSRFKCGFELKDFGVTTVHYSKLYVNYAVNDKCLSQLPGDMPCDYEVKTEGKAVVSVKPTVEGKASCSYFSENEKGATSVTVKRFESLSGVVAFETKYLLPVSAKGTVTISLNNGDKTGVSVSDSGLALLSNKGETLRTHSLNVWQTLRMEANTATGNVLIKLNGKQTKTIAFDSACTSFDNLKIEYTAKDTSTLLFSDLFVWVIQPEPADYVPEPKPAEKKGDYYVGMNICSLWRTGDHVGWDCITPFDEIKPLMGYYDEGLPEVADWELKWMCEHGIDFELYCWYSVEEDAPQKNTVLSSAIHGGHFHAKYSDKVKMALLWEAANCAHPKGVEAFKKYLVPYWLDYFFSDPRYMRIDNKAIMSVFGAGRLITDLGSAEAVKECLQYLRDKVKELGYDDLIIMACSGADPMMVECGFDAVHAYNWGKTGNELEFTKQCVASNTARDIIHVVPTVSTGFNNVGWASTRSPNMTTDDMKTVLEWFKSDMLPKYDKNSWESKLCMLSTWNEYGEGTYMCPSGLNRFGYLDAVRSAFCKDVPHTDIAPNDEQIKRLGYLHPQNRATIARLDWEQIPMQNEKALCKWTFTSKEDLDKWELIGLEDAEIKDGKFVGNVTKYDPQMILKEPLSIASSKVTHARVKINCYKEDHIVDCIQMYCKNTNGAQNFVPIATTLTNPKELVELSMQFTKSTGWNGTVTGLRFDPIFGAGHFELESIELMEAVPHLDLSINGKSVFAGLYPEEFNGEIYLPFNPRSGILGLTKTYHEWDRPNGKLSLWTKEKKAVFTIGSDTADIDGKQVKFNKAVWMKDGLPMLPIHILVDFMELTFERRGSDIYLNTK